MVLLCSVMPLSLDLVLCSRRRENRLRLSCKPWHPASRDTLKLRRNALPLILLVSVFTITYVYGRHFVTIHSDLQPLESIFLKKRLEVASSRLQRMLLRLQLYNQPTNDLSLGQTRDVGGHTHWSICAWCHQGSKRSKLNGSCDLEGHVRGR